MSWRTVCITKRCKLEYRMGYLVVRGEETNRIHLNEIGVLIIESTAVSLTTSLLNELCKNKVKVIFCDEKHNPHSELLNYYACYDSSRVIRQQIQWSQKIKNRVWQILIRDKITKQAKVLTNEGKENQAQLLYSYQREVEPGDASNREGHAAKVYFNALFGMDFSRDLECFINAALNYGYSIILSIFNREIVAQGCITQLGIWHSNTFNHFNLSSDLMEAFRPLVDKKVIEMNKIRVNDNELTTDEKHDILGILESEVLTNGESCKLPNAISIYVRGVLNALHNSDISLMPVISYV